MRFEFFRLRLTFRAREPVHFPPGKAGNVVRGTFGAILHRLSGAPEYARAFAPRAAPGAGPSGLADQPRPFVFRASHLDGRTLSPAEEFSFDVHLFDVRDPQPRHFVGAFAQVAMEGIGPRRGRADLVQVSALALDDSVARIVFEAGDPSIGALPAPLAVDLDRPPGSVTRLRVRFVTPTELKAEERVVDKPEFAILVARARDRLSTLRALYGQGPLAIDFRAMRERAARVRMTRCVLELAEVQRRSGRTGQVHPLGGFTGFAEYEGELGEFVPYLEAARWTGVGRQTVWGKGEIRLE